MASITANLSTSLNGSIKIAGDKSISHRSIILGALSIGETTVEGLLESQDILATISAMQAFGAEIEKKADNKWHINGLGVGGLDEPEKVLDLGNSGTGVRLLLGVAASNPITSFFSGDKSLSRRPMARVLKPLEMMGASFVSRSGGLLPLACNGPQTLQPIDYSLPVASAQVKSAILLAGLNTPGKTIVREPTPTRDHTERMLKQFGSEITIENDEQSHNIITLEGENELTGQDILVPGDPSSAAFPMVAGILAEDSRIEIKNVGINPLRFGLFEILNEMGAKTELIQKHDGVGEPTADIVVKASKLKGVTVPASIAPRMIDEYPILAVAAACASGTTRMLGLQELRVKESDRLTAMAIGLKACGVRVEETSDSLTVHGTGGQIDGGARIQTQLDHRIAMSFLTLGLNAKDPIIIDNGTTINTSFPGFVETMKSLGANLNFGDKGKG
ncbi:MAG: 3-phosphoshikimate 1-carboxyvinyltransferase [Rhodospirillaceae bacterium]|nr:3-phosphoshikimate 1-carboxyvinyltransferase [Rhodospirillaceae bacterium]OUU29787.1 MAG: 3-phosphoshikimate 1-carboxyvinyltransferase [Candidatus Endolissoclinum sp. TMED37]